MKMKFHFLAENNLAREEFPSFRERPSVIAA
jgi:hypothetical protein